MLMSPNKDETAVHGCHCQGDMAVRMRKVLQTAGLVFECVTCFFRVSYLYSSYMGVPPPPPPGHEHLKSEANLAEDRGEGLIDA